MWGPLRPKYPQKYNKQISDVKKTETHWLRARQGHTKHVCKIAGSKLSKTEWTLASEGILGVTLEPACTRPLNY